MFDDRVLLDDFFVFFFGELYIMVVRVIILVLVVVGFIGFICYWFLVVGFWFYVVQIVKVEWKSFFWIMNLFDLYFQKYFEFIFKGFLVWMFGGWMIVFMVFGWVSDEVFNVFLGY